MNPPAPSAVTLPARQPPTGTPPPAPAQRASVPPGAVTNSSPQHAPRILPQKSGAMRVEGEPRSSFACPRRATSPLAACPPPRAYVAPRRRIGPGGVPPGAAAGATQRPRCARPGRHRCERSSHGARRVGLPFGPAPTLRPPSCRKGVLRAGRVCARPLACVALRAKSPRPRLASLAPRRVRLRLTPSPCSRRRANRPLQLPSHRAQRRRESATVLPLQPPCPFHVARRSPPASKGSRGSRPYRARALSGAPSQLPASGGPSLRASLARWRGFIRLRPLSPAPRSTASVSPRPGALPCGACRVFRPR